MNKTTIDLSDEMIAALDRERARLGIGRGPMIRIILGERLDVSPAVQSEPAPAPVSSGVWVKDVNHVQ